MRIYWGCIDLRLGELGRVSKMHAFNRSFGAFFEDFDVGLHLAFFITFQKCIEA